MLKSKIISILFLSNLFFGNSICLSKTTEMEKGNSGNYFGIDAVTRANSDEDPKMVKISYRYSWNRNGFSIGPKIFTLINISSDDSENYNKYYNKEEYKKEILFKENKVGLGLSIGFDLSDNVTLMGTISGIKLFGQNHADDFGYDLELSLQIALGRNIHAQVSIGRTLLFYENTYNTEVQYEQYGYQYTSIRTEYLSEKVHVDTISLGLSYKF